MIKGNLRVKFGDIEAEEENRKMTSRRRKHIASATSLLLVLSVVAVHTAAQNGQQSAETTRVVTNADLQKLYLSLPITKMSTPRAADSHPDLSGVWLNPFPAVSEKNEDGSVRFDIGITQNTAARPPKYPLPTEPSYKPDYAAKVKAIVASQYGPSTPLDPEYDCKPMGVPRASMNAIQIVQTPKLIVILYESNFIGQTYRLIYADGRRHPGDLDSSFLGDSIGHWEGDTLVVDVIGLNDETWLGGGQGHTEPPAFGERYGHQIVERYALIHSDQEHVIERYTRHGNLLTYEATVEDPVMFTEPWVLTPRHWFLGGPDDRLLESFCESRDKSHIIPGSQSQ
jgi:hypothetical protein